jgi:hypothetical protein
MVPKLRTSKTAAKRRSQIVPCIVAAPVNHAALPSG